MMYEPIRLMLMSVGGGLADEFYMGKFYGYKKSKYMKGYGYRNAWKKKDIKDIRGRVEYYEGPVGRMREQL